jgi:hypothetical protein
MASSRAPEITVSQACQILLDYSVNRDELNEILQGFPEDIEINRVAIEYELQLLKIIFVGWALSYYAHQHPHKHALLETFWNGVRELATGLSTASSVSTGQDLDYFSIIAERLNNYLKVLEEASEDTPSASVVAFHFSKQCGHEGEPYTLIAGQKMFHFAVGGVKHYIESVRIV